MGQTADELRQEIDTKRDMAAEKIDQLEQKVTGAAEQVKGQVAGAADQVKEQVKQTVDWRHQVEERPLVALGAALAGGFVLGGMLGGNDDRSRHDDTRHKEAPITPARGGSSSMSSGIMAGAAGSGLMGTVREAAKNTGLEDTLNNLTTSLMSTLSDRVKEIADQIVPGMGEKLQNATGQGQAGASGNANSWSSGTSSPSGSSSFGTSRSGMADVPGSLDSPSSLLGSAGGTRPSDYAKGEFSDTTSNTAN